MKRILCSFAVAAAILSSCQQQQQASVAPAATPDSLVTTSIAYVNTDSLLSQYEYAKKLNDQLNDKAESARADLNQQARVFQQEVAEFQRKVQNNGFLSVERAQKEQNRLQKAEQDLQQKNDRLSAEFMQEQARLSAELQDTVHNFLAEYAKGRYTLILSNNMGDNVLFAAPGVDITPIVVKALNERYAKATAKSGK